MKVPEGEYLLALGPIVPFWLIRRKVVCCAMVKGPDVRLEEPGGPRKPRGARRREEEPAGGKTPLGDWSCEVKGILLLHDAVIAQDIWTGYLVSS